MNTAFIGFGSLAFIVIWMVAGIIEVTNEMNKF
jgi:hypothetical protein